MNITNRVKTKMTKRNKDTETEGYGKKSRTVLMMSSLLIQPLVPVYGTPVIAYTIQKFLKADWTIYFLAGFKPKPVDEGLAKQLHIIWFEGPLLRILRTFGDEVRKIGFFFRAIWWSIAQILFLAKGFWIITRHKVDCIYSWDVNAAPAAWILSKLFGVKWIARYLGTVFLWDQMNNMAWKVRSWQQVIAYKCRADLVIMTNDGTLGDYVLDKLGVDKDKIRFWINGVDKQAFSIIQPKEIAKERLGMNKSYVLLSVSRLDSCKRVDRCISVMPEIISKIPGVILMVVGDGPARPALEKLGRELNVASHVRFVGAVRHEDVPLYYAAADVYLSLNDYSNLVNPLLEAMIAGKCCVVLNVGGISNLIKDGVTGIIISKVQLNSLGQILIFLYENQVLRETLGKNAREWACQNLKTWDERLSQELQEVENILLS